MPFVAPVRSFQARGLVLAACVLALSAAGKGQTIHSDRTMQDVYKAEAAQRADLAAVDGRAVFANYVDADGVAFGYRVYRPEAAEPAAKDADQPGRKYPMYTYWGSALPLALRSSQATYPCYVVNVGVSDKIPRDWKARTANAFRVIAETVMAEYGNVDASRIYTGGWSKCGGAAWRAVLSYPDFFAAILPSAATCDVSKAPLVVSRQIGVWMFLGVKDRIFTNGRNNNAVHMAKAMTAAGGKPRYTQYTQGTHHEIWVSDSLTNPNWNDLSAFREWLFKQRKSEAPWPIIDSPVTGTAQVNKAFRYQITAGNSPTGFSAAPLPAGLVLDTKTGGLSGTPTAAGTVFVTLNANNAKGAGVSTLMLTIRK